jgi:hypothetical protein
MTGAKRLWSELQPWEWRSRLARVHPKLNEDCLIAEGRRVPELRPEIDAQKSKEDRVRVVLRYFGDERHPQPEPANPPRYGPAIDGGEPVFRCPSCFSLFQCCSATVLASSTTLGTRRCSLSRSGPSRRPASPTSSTGWWHETDRQAATHTRPRSRPLGLEIRLHAMPRLGACAKMSRTQGRDFLTAAEAMKPRRLMFVHGLYSGMFFQCRWYQVPKSKLAFGDDTR